MIQDTRPREVTTADASCFSLIIVDVYFEGGAERVPAIFQGYKFACIARKGARELSFPGEPKSFPMRPLWKRTPLKHISTVRGIALAPRAPTSVQEGDSLPRDSSALCFPRGQLRTLSLVAISMYPTRVRETTSPAIKDQSHPALSLSCPVAGG